MATVIAYCRKRKQENRCVYIYHYRLYTKKQLHYILCNAAAFVYLVYPGPVGSEFYLGKDFANGIVEYQVGRMVHIGA